jgi:hypothetical protein
VIIALELEAINNELADLSSVGSRRTESQQEAWSAKRFAPMASPGVQAVEPRITVAAATSSRFQRCFNPLLRGKTMSVAEMTDAAKKAGHKSKSKSFRTIVSLALLNQQADVQAGEPRTVHGHVTRAQHTYGGDQCPPAQQEQRQQQQQQHWRKR